MRQGNGVDNFDHRIVDFESKGRIDGEPAKRGIGEMELTIPKWKR